MTKEEILKDVDVFNYHGWREQCKHIISEVYELVEAVHDYETHNEQTSILNNWNDICEEIADIEFMLNQFKEKYLVKDINISAWKDYKIKRESKRINEGYYEK